MALSGPIRIGLLCCLLLPYLFCSAQDSLSCFEKVFSFPDKLFSTLDKRASKAEEKLNRQTSQYLSRLEKQEARLKKKKMLKKDSLLATTLFSDIDQQYQKLKNASGKVSGYTSVYSGHLDSLSTALSFLKNNNIASFSTHPALEQTLQNYKNLQTKLNATEQIRKQLLERQRLLKEQFQRLGMVKELKQFRKQVYYYQAQVREYSAHHKFHCPSHNLKIEKYI